MRREKDTQKRERESVFLILQTNSRFSRNGDCAACRRFEQKKKGAPRGRSSPSNALIPMHRAHRESSLGRKHVERASEATNAHEKYRRHFRIPISGYGKKTKSTDAERAFAIKLETQKDSLCRRRVDFSGHLSGGPVVDKSPLALGQGHELDRLADRGRRGVDDFGR